MKRIVLVLLAAAIVCGAAYQGQEKPRKRQMKDRVLREGKMVCIGCTLNKEYGVDAQCTLHAKHRLGFLDGEGKIWTLVDNRRGHPIATNKKLRGKSVQVFGWFYPKHQYLEFWKYNLKKGDKWVAYDYCKVCGFEPGDHQDKDVCPGCDEE